MTVNADRPRTWRMSFSMTPTQIVDGSKTVTRRHADTWRTIRAGDLIVPIRKGQGLKRGERQEPLIDGRLIVTSVRLEPLASVDYLGTSFQARARKPEAAFFAHIQEHAQCAPHECAFVDDLPVNVEAAERFGWKGVLYRPDGTLAQKLRALGASVGT
jgi:hypothetical protein